MPDEPKIPIVRLLPDEPKIPIVRLLVGLVLVYFGFLAILGNSVSYADFSNLDNYTFSEEPVSVQGFSTTEYDESRLPRRIVIPDIGINLDVQKSEIINGYWQVHEHTANWGVGSGIPGEIGNQVVFAHATEGLFEPLKELGKGSIVYVLTDSGWHDYTVEEIKEVYPNQTEVIDQTTDERLTLYTCSGYADSKRLVIVAK